MPSSVRQNIISTRTLSRNVGELLRRFWKSVCSRDRSWAYIGLVLLVTVSAAALGLRKYGIFGCSASGYSSDTYLSYCNVASYGDYDHGAIWFDLEPAATAAVANARVLFLGNSRTQFAFSSETTANWFSSLSVSYYLLGFFHNENYTFEMPLIRKLHPRARVYVVNIDSFFDPSESQPGKMVMLDESARARYEQKRDWQRMHRAICPRFGVACGNEGAFFRSRSSGAWRVTGGPFPTQAVSYDDRIDHKMLPAYTAAARKFLPDLTAEHACTILTIVPTVETRIGTANAIASAVGWKLVAPRLSGLTTFDKVHLDEESAQRWSAAFLEEAGPQIQKCLSEKPESHVAMSATDLRAAN